MEHAIRTKKTSFAGLSDMLEKQEELEQSIRELTLDKREMERHIIKRLVKNGREDLFNINWRKVRVARNRGEFK